MFIKTLKTWARRIIWRTGLGYSPLYKRFRDRRYLQQHRAFNLLDEKRLAFYRQFIQPDDLVFDIGANYGFRTKIFLKLGARVVAVEPQPACVEVITRAYPSTPNLHIIAKGVSDHEGTAAIHMSSSSLLTTMTEEWVEKWEQRDNTTKPFWKTVTIPITTLDNMIKQYGSPRFIKIDVEGHELHVLKGLTQPVAQLSFEYLPDLLERTRDCIAYLGTLGTPEFNLATGESLKLIFTSWVSGEDVMRWLDDHKGELDLFGDVYVRFPELLGSRQAPRGEPS